MLAYAKQIESYDQHNKLKHLSLPVSHYLAIFFFFTLDKQSTMCLLRLVLISLNGISESTFIPADTENKPTVHSACKPL